MGRRERQTRYSDIVRLFEITGADKLHISVDSENYGSATKIVHVWMNGKMERHNRGKVKVVMRSFKRFRCQYEYEFIQNTPFLGTYFDGHTQIVEDEKLIAELLILAFKVHSQSGNQIYHIDIERNKNENGRFDIEYNVVENRKLHVCDDFEWGNER